MDTRISMMDVWHIMEFKSYTIVLFKCGCRFYSTVSA